MYTYRSISRALPQIQADSENKAELYRKFFDVLEPEIKKIRDLMAFHTNTVKTLTKIMIEMAANEKRKEIPSETRDSLQIVFNIWVLIQIDVIFTSVPVNQQYKILIQ